MHQLRYFVCMHSNSGTNIYYIHLLHLFHLLYSPHRIIESNRLNVNPSMHKGSYLTQKKTSEEEQDGRNIH